MDTEIETKSASVSRSLAPEDVQPGQYVCVTRILQEYMPWWAILEESFKTPELIRLTWLPPDSSTPLKVIEACLPFVLVQQVDGVHRMLDLRRCRLARVSERFGSRAFKRLRRGTRTPTIEKC